MNEEFYRQQVAFFRERKRRPWYVMMFPFIVLYMGFCWLNWKVSDAFNLEITDRMGIIIWESLVALWATITGLLIWRIIVAFPYITAMIIAIFFHTGAASPATNPQHAPTVALTAYGTHTRSSWLDTVRFLSPADAQKLRTTTNVTNIMVIDESTGRVQIAANLKSNPASSVWVLQNSYPFAISNVSVNGKSAAMTINSENVTLNQGQAFVLREDPTIAYMIGSDGSIYAAGTMSEAIVGSTTAIPDPGLPANPAMSLPE